MVQYNSTKIKKLKHSQKRVDSFNSFYIFHFSSLFHDMMGKILKKKVFSLNKLNKILLMNIGFIVVAFGSYLCLKGSAIGTPPWIATYKGLSEFIFSVGLWSIIAQFLFIFSTYLIDRKIPAFGTFWNMVFTGLMIDLFLAIDFFPVIKRTFPSFLLFTSGVSLMAFGMTLAKQTGMGTGARTHLSFVLREKFGMKLNHSSYGIETLGILIAFLCAGPLSWGTLAYVLVFANTLKWSSEILHRFEQRKLVSVSKPR
jgi:uncharacterized protein